LDTSIGAKENELSTAQGHVEQSSAEMARLNGKIGEQDAFIAAEQASFD